MAESFFGSEETPPKENEGVCSGFLASPPLPPPPPNENPPLLAFDSLVVVVVVGAAGVEPKENEGVEDTALGSLALG